MRDDVSDTEEEEEDEEGVHDGGGNPLGLK